MHSHGHLFLSGRIRSQTGAKEGSLAQRDRAIFPAIAAVGGMLAPALIYLFFNHGDAIGQQGWAIPAATDIAFLL